MMRGFFGFVLTICLAASVAQAAPVKVTKMEGLMGGLWNAYAPTTLNYGGKERMWFGGWEKQADQGSDIIYYSENLGTQWTAPVVSFKKADYAVNDPTVIQHPVNKDWLFMYYTALHKNHQNGNQLTLKNIVGFASSINGGRTWTDHGIIIGQNNGYNAHGAWAPTAVLPANKKEIWLYYHTNSPSNIILRTRLDINGWKQIGKTELVMFPGEASQHGRVNIDIARDGGTYHMVSNDFSLNNVGYYKSTDGLVFARANVDSPMVKGGANWVLTPHIRVLKDKLIQLYFGFGHANNACSAWWKQNGINNNCSDSLHRWTIQLP